MTTYAVFHGSKLVDYVDARSAREAIRKVAIANDVDPDGPAPLGLTAEPHQFVRTSMY